MFHLRIKYDNNGPRKYLQKNFRFERSVFDPLGFQTIEEVEHYIAYSDLPQNNYQIVDEDFQIILDINIFNMKSFINQLLVI